MRARVRLAMLADYMSGMTLSQVGEKHGVSYSVVYQRLRENYPSVVRPPGRLRKRWQLEQARRLLSELTQDELRQLLAYLLKDLLQPDEAIRLTAEKSTD